MAMQTIMKHIVIGGLLLLLLAFPALAESAGTDAVESEATEPETTEAEPSETSESTSARSQSDVVQGLAPAHVRGGFVSISGIYDNLKGSQTVISKYTPANQGTRPGARLGLWGYSNGIGYNLLGRYGDQTDQQYEAGVDLKRYWQSKFEFTKFPHRLINDPLANLDAAKGGPVVRHTSNDEDINYCPVYQEARWTNRIKAGSLVTFKLDYRNQIRKGTYQGRTMSKCSNCHVVSNVNEMDQKTEEWKAGVAVGNARANLGYEYLSRVFQESAPTPLNLYDEVQHPVSGARVFTNRAQFEKSDGPLPYNQLPRFEKRRHMVKGRVEVFEDGGALMGTYLNGKDSNKTSNYAVDTNLLSGRYSGFLGKSFRVNVIVRDLDIDSESLFVDVNERVADGGPQAGKTYPEAYPSYGEADYWARSSLTRNVFDFKVNGRLKLADRTYFRVGYVYEGLERPTFEVRNTDTNTLKLGFSSSAYKTVRAQLKYQYDSIKRPFTHIHAALPPGLQMEPTPNPFVGVQYYEIYGAREANLTNFPTKEHNLFASVTWTPSDRVGLTAQFRGVEGSNGSANDISDWNNSVMAPSVQLWLAPSEKVDLLASYTFTGRRTDSLFTIAVYDG
jgi:hypothetical protein